MRREYFRSVSLVHVLTIAPTFLLLSSSLFSTPASYFQLSSLCDALRHATPAGAPPSMSSARAAAVASDAAAHLQQAQAAAADDGAVSLFF